MRSSNDEEAHVRPQLRQQPTADEVARNPANDSLDGEAALDLLRWHIDRFDRLRASLASRAAVVLSATAVLVAGQAFLANLYFANRHTRVWDWLVAGALLVSLAFAMAAGWAA